MSSNRVKKTFLDAARIYVKGGTGGNGYMKNGGIGGKGGDIYFEGVKNATLKGAKKPVRSKQWKAGTGENCSNFRIFGNSGNDLIIPVPLGTSVQTDLDQKLGDVLNAGDKILIARGGSGGNPANQFAGQIGENHHIKLFLKLIADIGLVGFPNAGKSTILKALSHAKPKIASYPFTTIEPKIGVMKYKDLREITVADLPGLIEGAWMNAGMGHKFLRHVERTKLLLFVVDVEGFQLGPDYPFRSPIENVILLNKELELYQADLIEKPSLLLVNKMDKADSDKNFSLLKDQLANVEEVSKTMEEEMRPEQFIKFDDIVACSAKFDKQSMARVKERLREQVDSHASLWNEDALLEAHEKIKSQLYERSEKYV